MAKHADPPSLTSGNQRANSLILKQIEIEKTLDTDLSLWYPRPWPDSRLLSPTAEKRHTTRNTKDTKSIKKFFFHDTIIRDVLLAML